MSSTFARSLRTLLILGRVSNLPTVWSNCLAGWWLGGHAHQQRLPFLFIGATLLYIGGMFLNDAFDAVFDREFRPERPIPSGHITRAAVWRWGTGFLMAGAACLFGAGETAGYAGLGLVFAILLYDAVHKRIVFAPVLMGICRLLLYLVAALSANQVLPGLAVWSGVVLAAYIAGLSFFARSESIPGPLRFWPVLLLASPVVLALLVNSGTYRPRALLLSTVFLLWSIKCMRSLLSRESRDIGRAVSGLLAGIVWVDWLAVADAPRECGIIFLILFALAMLFQKFIPAT